MFLLFCPVLGVLAEYSCVPAVGLDHGAIPPCNSCALRSHSCGLLFVHYSQITFGYSVCPTSRSCAQRWLAELCSCCSVLGVFAEHSCIPAVGLDHGVIPPCNSCTLSSHSCGRLFVYYSRMSFGYSVCPNQSVLCSAVAC